MIKLDTYLEKPFIKFILWFLTGLFIVFYGILNVKADTYNSSQFSAQLYDNFGPNLSPVTTNYTNNRYEGTIPTMVANSSGAAWGISSPIGLLANHTYTMTIEITGTYGGKLVLSTFNRIGVGTTLQNAINSYQNNSSVKEIYSKVLGNGITIQFAFTPSINSSYIVFPFSTSYGGSNQYFYLSSVIIDDLGFEGVSQDDINNSLNNQTTIINGSIQDSTDNINDNIDDMENSINNNIKDNFNSCVDSPNLIDLSQFNTITTNGLTFRKTDDGVITINGTVTATFGLSLTHVTLSPGEYSMASNSYENVYLFNYNTLTTFLESGQTKYLDTSTTFGVDMYFAEVGKVYNNVIIKPMLNVGPPKSFEPFGEICTNKIDQTNDKLDNIDGTLNNSNIDSNNVSSSFEDFNNFLDDNSTITQLVTLPITLYTAILNNVNGTCQPFNFGDLYGVNLSLPCVNIGNYLGSFLWGMIDIIISGFAVYFIAKKLVKVFNNVSSMKEGDVIDD